MFMFFSSDIKVPFGSRGYINIDIDILNLDAWVYELGISILKSHRVSFWNPYSPTTLFWIKFRRLDQTAPGTPRYRLLFRSS
jgi:hypothetical protein